MTTINLRHIEEKDMPFLWDMLYEMVHIPVNKPPKEQLLRKPEISRCLEGWGRTGDQGFIAENEEGCPVGAAWYRRFRADAPGYGFVDEQTPELDIAVLPSYTGKGIGSLLLQKLIEQCAAEGYGALSLSVDPSNAALRLYERFGFGKVGESGTSWTMLLRLPKNV
ncbi:GNAT family N-acetyltransferase [Paenibacillus turpanensis]|uniref:GNAT family N-acetyltransferase n=1 Tax=Paenibacillus turpanensis TaxID=2689078 RepID=UPI001FB6BE91|nr:GNAT family N-acetyltransferase [Paenibacillus turpanensis]